MSSGSETRQRSKSVRVRCTDAELAAIEAASEKAGLASVGEFIRDRALDGSGTRSRRLSKLDRAELCRLLGEAGKIGSNINQLAKVANGKGELPSAATLRRIGDEVRALSGGIMAALGRRDRDRDGD